MYQAQQLLYNTVYGLDEDGIVETLKIQSDYNATFIKRLNEEITKEKAEVAEWKGKEDEDVRTA
jgi:hypothetical protein